eukprot:COSAG01_NODE_2611_length_7384_cov_7.141386_9_plen_153_part_00
MTSRFGRSSRELGVPVEALVALVAQHTPGLEAVQCVRHGGLGSSSPACTRAYVFSSHGLWWPVGSSSSACMHAYVFSSHGLNGDLWVAGLSSKQRTQSTTSGGWQSGCGRCCADRRAHCSMSPARQSFCRAWLAPVQPSRAPLGNGSRTWRC